MQSYQVTAFGAPLAKAEGPVPEPKNAEVVLKVDACGVCHSDIHLWEGHFDLGNGRQLPFGSGPDMLPITPGHEIVGEVVALGPDATGVAVGDRRIVFPWIGCGACAICAAGNEHLCNKPRAPGITIDGGYSDHVLVPDAKYLLDYEGLPADLACTYACSGLTAYSALKKVGRLGDRDPLVIVGAGGVGLAGVRFAKAVTGQAPIVVDIDDAKLEAAREAGAVETLNSRDEDAGKRLFKMTGGAAASIDFVGAESSFKFADRALRKGGKVIVVGLFGGSITLPLPLIPMRSIMVQGSYVGSLAEMKELLALVRGGIVAPMPIENRPLDRATETLEDLRAGRIVGRIVLRP